jgi:type II secretory pathway pseudopilin PulG
VVTRRSDEGTTLVEVLVALAVISTVMAALGTFFINSFLTVNQQRGQQGAAELANAAMEQIRALKGSSLMTGRGQIKSTSQWNSAPAAVQPYLATTKLVWDPLITDPASTLGDDAAVPTATQTMTMEKTTYARTVYVGACDIYVGTSTDCVNPATTSAPADPTKDLLFFRVVVLITWPAQNCPAGSCSFVATTLIARGSEPVFDFHRPAPVIKTTAATFYKGVAVSFQIDASGGQLPNTWTVSALPAGLTVSPAGLVSGSPATVGSTLSMVVVTDKLGRSDTENITWTVVLPPTLTMPANAQNHVGETVALATTATGGVTPFTYTTVGLAPGLAINPTTGAITGSVTTAGTFATTVTATDNNGQKATGTYTHTVYPALLLAAITDRQVALGTAVTATAAASGGDSHYTYGAPGLPLGVLINASTGVISGIPTVPGRYLPTVTVTDGLGGRAATTFGLVVTTTSSLVFTSPSLAAADQAGTVGTPVNLPITTNGGTLGLSPVTTVSGLPPGLTYNALSGKVTGKPTAAGTYVVTVVATNVLPPQSSNLTFLWTVT